MPALWRPNWLVRASCGRPTRKYAADIDGVLRWARESRERLARLDIEALAGLERRVTELGTQVVTAAGALTAARVKAAKGLAKAVTAELSGLAMAGADFTVSVSPLAARADDSAPVMLASGATVHAGHDGVDAVEFGSAAHRPDDVLPLTKTASGGELSRVMLALEVVLAASAEGTTMVFGRSTPVSRAGQRCRSAGGWPGWPDPSGHRRHPPARR